MTPPPWDAMNAPVGLWISAAEVSADGRRLTATFIGSPGPATEPCGVDYTGRAVESANAVVVIIDEHPYAGGGEQACNAIGYTRTATVDLAAPLGERAVLEVMQGQPVPVTMALRRRHARSSQLGPVPGADGQSVTRPWSGRQPWGDSCRRPTARRSTSASSAALVQARKSRSVLRGQGDRRQVGHRAATPSASMPTCRHSATARARW